MADAQNGKRHAINDWVIQIQKRRCTVRKVDEKKTKGNNEKNRYFGVFTLAPLWQSANRNATRASAGAGLLVRRQRHKTDKTRAVAILFLCSVRDGRLTVSQLSQASRSSTFNFIILNFHFIL